MEILVGCEMSGVVRDEFIRRGHNAVSCDIVDSLSPGPHIKGDIFDAINSRHWDMLICFPPCTHLCVSGARHFKAKRASGEQGKALAFVWRLLNADIEKIGMENPVGIINTEIRAPSQIIQPWMFGHGETKKTCLWLKNLPLLTPTNIVEGRENKIHRMAPGPNRAMLRSLTYPGIAKAMAEQWG